MNAVIIIPAHNEERKISEVIEGIRAVGLWAIVVVDDGSADKTATVAAQAGALVLRHRINRGQGAALRTGIDFALARGFTSAVFFDADGQMEPSEINLLLDKLNDGHDVVFGSRNLGRASNMPLSRKIVKGLALIFTRLTTGLEITDTHMGFQAWRMETLRCVNLDQDRMAHASQILSEIARLKLKYTEAPVTIKYTDYSLRKGQNNLGLFGILWDLLIK